MGMHTSKIRSREFHVCECMQSVRTSCYPRIWQRQGLPSAYAPPVDCSALQTGKSKAGEFRVCECINRAYISIYSRV